jgi:hypothetical protein
MSLINDVTVTRPLTWNQTSGKNFAQKLGISSLIVFSFVSFSPVSII